jgi:hypothetical protein
VSKHQEQVAADDADTPEELAAHPDLRALLRVTRRRNRQFVVARLLVEDFARADGEDVGVAWRRFRRALEIDRISALSKGELKKADVAGLAMEVDARVGVD